MSTGPSTGPSTGTRTGASTDVAIATSGLTRSYGATTALEGATLALEAGRVHGLLGRNGAGKTTLLRLLTGLDRPTAGTARLLGEDPFENPRLAGRFCFVKESQVYPESFRVHHVLRAASLLFPRWDDDRAAELVDRFALPTRRPVKKLSRGMTSALGVVVGLAARAEVTLFDEPYLGLDAVARQLFYDALLEEVALEPRTVVLSTHLIDEVDHLLERVVVVDHGRVVLDADADEVRGSAVEVTGPSAAVDAFTGGRRLLRREVLGGTARATVATRATREERARADRLGVDLAPVSLQQVVVGLTTAAEPARPLQEVLR
ncbi:ATP-binding cassette domain-containing protein [Cellulomonas marina]|uniref:ABC-2 type transport system ATP-binding protein n=1 Tax=Cellulomonas marina TaxID=988821 RepID=A0A1I1AQ21_9CELL|nr:ABC transporter ATP-binding protein [Cellulomonas marina]GIG30802.1 ABC transporter ATP-binding protein [Cellulomonas marina]SFB38578.1 ABC-2 type transport system ATP-binding protein [Cellulomonas marina]